jgi:hypothetical protein
MFKPEFPISTLAPGICPLYLAVKAAQSPAGRAERPCPRLSTTQNPPLRSSLRAPEPRRNRYFPFYHPTIPLILMHAQLGAGRNRVKRCRVAANRSMDTATSAS